MAAVSLRQRKDPSAFIQAFSGSNRYILDYLMEEVLAQQTPDTQQFLLFTSVLERLTDSLCAHVLTAVTGVGGRGGSRSAPTDDEGSWPSLEDLDAANLFIVPLDDTRHWYRYHRLFADLLNQRLQKTAPQLIPVLHARARDWFREEGWPEEAIRHALQAGDDEEAVRLVEEAAEPALQKSQLHTILRWVQALPQEQVRERSGLRLYYAWALFMSGAPFEEVETWLPQLEEGTLREAPLQGKAPQQDEAPLPAAVLIHAFVAAMRGEMREARRLGQQALSGLGPDDPFWRSMAVWVLSISYHDPLAEPLREGLTWEDAAREARESDNLLVMVSAMCEQGHDYKRHGRLHDARDVFDRALALATPPAARPAAANSVQRLPIAGEALMGLAEIDLEWNKLESAEALLDEGLALTRQWREVAALPGFLQLTRLRRAQGDQEGAEEALREAARLALLFDATELDDVVVAAYQARLGIMQGRPHLAQAWAVERGLSDLGPAPEEGEEYVALRYFEKMILSRLWLAEGELDAALQLQDPLLSIFGEWQHVRLMIETLLLRAQVHAARGEMDRALSDVREALILGEPEGFMRVFLDEGEPMLHLLGSLLAAEQGPQEFLNKLVVSFDDGARSATVLGSQPLIEPLTARELEILQLVAEGLSNREVGQRLFLSLPTVKWHTSNIYGKLGVKNRTTAVAKARELGILQS